MTGVGNPRIFLSPPHQSGREGDYIAQALASNYITSLGPQVDEFERRFCRVTGFENALAVSSGTAALHLALVVLGVGPGDLVLASDLTFIGSINPVLYQGAEPVFIDSERVSWNMDPELLARELEYLASQDRKPKAVVVTDLYGQCADLEALLAVCRPHGVAVICDSAEALGAKYRGNSAGSGALMAAFSFNGNKIITTSGGGMLVSPERDLIDQARNLAQQAREPLPYYEHRRIGFNYRMSNILAGLGLGQLEVLEERVRAKRDIFRRYQKGLGNLPGISFMPEAAWGQSNRWLSVMMVDQAEFGADPEEIRLALEEQNIESRPVWKPMHMQPVFQGRRCRGGAVGEDLFSRGLCLPSGTQLEQTDQQRVIQAVRELRG
ncbi:MAG: aminotransferase class I/II-fold pyridoxal phosphate-dependent enzyme [Proteobacteria bacterium]|nr:aminotransferase class I/II-fold pyridoxal phosphate-dependent enzyme [Pseudomonadota bacterium]MBU4384660.1 aminotransferase class I/II-fold pyridoxal phosphate-dependent enzyme [Pseudomonadota bacterium]MCG2766193.1 aminotransferase class I/II-fold pyridoxal phosphate-dependent enzyme [Desulfarculaceae bacterium]